MAVNPPPLQSKTKGKMNSIIIMVSVATVLGLLAAVGIWQYLTQAQKQVQELTVTRAVVVASKKIPAGTKITDEFIAIKDFPAMAIPEDYPESLDAIKDRVSKSTLEEGEIITEARLITEGAAGGLPMVIPEGLRAITIKTTEVTGVGGFLSPGDKVDVLSVISQSEERTFSKTILQNILVLAVGKKLIDPDNIGETEDQETASEVTVALKLQDTEILALASQTGDLQLILRRRGDENILPSIGANLEDVYGSILEDSSQAPPATLSEASNVVKNLNAIEVILGDQKSYQYY